LDLGAGSGAWADRLSTLGYVVTAVDANADTFQGQSPFIAADLDHDDFVSALEAPFDLITAVEVIEHLESPVGFLRSIVSLLGPDGVVLLTTPNVDSAPSKMKFLLKGKLRGMDEHGDPTHLSPILWWTFVNRVLPRVGLDLVARYGFPPQTFNSGRPAFTRAFRLFAPLLRDDVLTGDIHVLLMRKDRESSAVEEALDVKSHRGSG